MTDTGFDKQIGATLQFEGGYVNDPDDAGGETKFGISKASYPDLDIKALTRAQAIAIYKRDYWDKPGFGRLPDAIGGKVFDLGVNMGQATAVRLLQDAANSLIPSARLQRDGRLGPQTLGVVAGIDGKTLLDALRMMADRRYRKLAAEHPQMRKFLTGWLRRANA